MSGITMAAQELLIVTQLDCFNCTTNRKANPGTRDPLFTSLICKQCLELFMLHLSGAETCGEPCNIQGNMLMRFAQVHVKLTQN